ncbi:MAG: TRAP transporter large permease [Haloferacaceae archaeon]
MLELVAPLVAFAVLLALGVPVFVSMGLSSVAFLTLSDTMNTFVFTNAMFTGLNEFALIAVPLFIVTGDAIFEAGMADELLDFVETLVGGLQTGFGSATILGCGLFATISGANTADAATIGRIALDRLEEIGYPRDYAAAMIAGGASTGVLIPPSISYIVAGIMLGIPSSTLFLAAFVPGTLILLGLAATNVLMNRRHSYEAGESDFLGLRAVGAAGWRAKYALLVPVVLLGGIYAGVFTPTEAAAVAIGVTVLISGLRGRLSIGDLPVVFERSALVNAIVSPNIATGIVFSQVLAGVGVPTALANALLGTSQDFYVVTALMLLFFLAAGAVMEITPNIIILGPLFLPIATRVGMSPVHFTVFFISALGVGFITPPIGINLYVLSGVSGESVHDIARRAVPFTLGMLLTVLVIGWFPELYMWIVGGGA